MASEANGTRLHSSLVLNLDTMYAKVSSKGWNLVLDCPLGWNLYALWPLPGLLPLLLFEDEDPPLPPLLEYRPRPPLLPLPLIVFTVTLLLF